MKKHFKYGVYATVLVTMWLLVSHLLGYEMLTNEEYDTLNWIVFVTITWIMGYAVVRIYEHFYGMPWTERSE